MTDDHFTAHDEEETQPLARSTCHICGGTLFTWGKAASYASAGTAFVDDKHNLLFPQGERLRVRMCQRCGNIQFFVDLLDKD
ncbi:MAG: hypothetical protein U0694_22795 [Anaerolineae bacterium]